VIGYQRSILVGAVFMAAGLFAITLPNPDIFKLGLATIIVGNGMFKPNISTMVGQLYGMNDQRRDSGFTIFYMGINGGGFIAPILTGSWRKACRQTAPRPTRSCSSPPASACCRCLVPDRPPMLKGIGAPPAQLASPMRARSPSSSARHRDPGVYFLLKLGAEKLQGILSVLFIALAIMLMVEGIRNGKVARDKTIAMLIIFFFNVMFWCFFEQAGSSFTFLADHIVDRDFGGWTFPTGWFQSVNTLAIIVCAPIVAAVWVMLGRNAEPVDPAQVRPRPDLQRPGLPAADVRAAAPGRHDGKIPFWTLFMVYVIQSVGELCLSPIGLSMVTKLAPTRLVGLGMGGWFLSTGIGNNLSGIFASHVSGESGMSVASALGGYTFGFWSLVGSRRAAVPDRTADPEADARREVSARGGR
jgi:POT family proton-dependent oligopeptide transporter